MLLRPAPPAPAVPDAGDGYRPLRRLALLLGLALAVLAGTLAQAPSAAAYPGAPWFEPDKPYTGNFPDPDVLRVDDTYYAYSTTTGGSYLPVSRSKDLSTWIARSVYDPGPPNSGDVWFNDAFPSPARWGADVGSGGRMTKQIWAPSVERIGGRFVLFYSIRTVLSPERYCISVATSASPQGPFVDNSGGPIVCDPDPKGSIDPDVFVDPANGTPYLIWKSEGVPGSQPTKIWVQQLDGSGTAFAPGSPRRELLRTSQGWEGNLIENPSMVRHQGQLYLFYSGNEWKSASYATGYALCDSVLGPCHKPRGTALLASNGGQLGPGGPSAFVDAGGHLRMAYHYWNAPFTNYPAYPQCESNKSCQSQGQRRMAITELGGAGGGLSIGPARPAPAPVDTGRACPSGVPGAGFPDVPGGAAHGRAIDCVVWWGVAQGSGGLYHPTGGVTRGQMAAFLARAVLESGGSLPPAGNAFRDVDGSVHEQAIERLAAAGVIAGITPDRYAPERPVSREQMASLLMRTLKHRTGQTPQGTADWFGDDDASAHRGAIDAAASAGLATGTGPATYSPTATVRRDQMATFQSRLLELFVRAGAPLPRR